MMKHRKQLYDQLNFLNEEAPGLLKGGNKQDLVRVLRCRIGVDKAISSDDDSYAWWLLIKGDTACAPYRENLKVLTLNEVMELGATCDLSWYAPVWQKRQWLWHQQYIGGAQ